MKVFFAFTFAIFFLYSCNENRDKSNRLSSSERLSNDYDSIHFNSKMKIDTTGCSWLGSGRSVLDSLIYATAIVKAYSDTFLATAKYKRLLTCNIPSFVMIPGDTVLVTGNVYRISSLDDGGYPTIITEMVYRKK